MTPNMLNTYVADDTLPHLKEYAGVTARLQNEGKMDLFMNSAISLANEMGVKVCDCYKIWKQLSKTEDTTLMLVNRINHPTKEMHELFANCLMQVIFEDGEISTEEVSTMYQNK